MDTLGVVGTLFTTNVVLAEPLQLVNLEPPLPPGKLYVTETAYTVLPAVVPEEIESVELLLPVPLPPAVQAYWSAATPVGRVRLPTVAVNVTEVELLAQ